MQSKPRSAPQKYATLPVAGERPELEIISKVTRKRHKTFNVLDIEILSTETKGKKHGLGKKRALCTNGRVKIPKWEFWNYP